uniref:Uncharacterized protein n=1 Tax=Glossina pallidipes TaxID=7398 RepID=A0A1B0A8K0_GLOPL
MVEPTKVFEASHFSIEVYYYGCRDASESSVQSKAHRKRSNILDTFSLPLVRIQLAIMRELTAPVAQWIRHRPPKPGIVGSSPIWGKVGLVTCMGRLLVKSTNWSSTCINPWFSTSLHWIAHDLKLDENWYVDVVEGFIR